MPIVDTQNRFAWPCLRKLPPSTSNELSARRVLYLTFDDGPDPVGTPAVLAVLEQFGVRATFFVVADAAIRHPALLKAITAAGHSVGNHSLDHRYGAFFGSRKVLRHWIGEAERRLNGELGHGTVGFRSPAGVRTPHLAPVLWELGLPLIHWQKRFYDSVWPWRANAAVASLVSAPSGSIILLHDRQQTRNLPTFLRTLSQYLTSARAMQIEFRALQRADCLAYLATIPVGKNGKAGVVAAPDSQDASVCRV